MTTDVKRLHINVICNKEIPGQEVKVDHKLICNFRDGLEVPQDFEI